MGGNHKDGFLFLSHSQELIRACFHRIECLKRFCMDMQAWQIISSLFVLTFTALGFHFLNKMLTLLLGLCSVIFSSMIFSFSQRNYHFLNTTGSKPSSQETIITDNIVTFMELMHSSKKV